MTEKPPILDSRTLPEILQQLQELAKNKVPEWQPQPEGDAGTMLQRIYARLLELAIQRLNQVPEKNRLAFLDTMGVSLLPPSPATVPLTFSLTPGTPATLIPKGAQAGTQPSGQQPAVIFETEDDLTVIPAQIVPALTIDPTWDRYTDQTDVLGGQSAIGFTPFVGSKRMPHILYLGDDALLNFSRATSVELKLSWESGRSPTEVADFFLNLSYQYHTRGIVKTVTPVITFPSESPNLISLKFTIPDPIDQETIQGVGLTKEIQSRWLQAVLSTPFPDALVAQNLRLNQLRLIVSASDLLPDLAFSNTAPVDVTKDFFPFGDAPEISDAFYLASEEVFAKAGAQVTIKFDVRSLRPPKLVWEYSSRSRDQGQWEPVIIPPEFVFPPNIPHPIPPGQKANTIQMVSLKEDGFIVGVTSQRGQTTVNGISAFWLRTRLVDGGYNHPPKIKIFEILEQQDEQTLVFRSPDVGFTNQTLIIFTKPDGTSASFLPFGEKPSPADIFYFGETESTVSSPEARSQSGIDMGAVLAAAADIPLPSLMLLKVELDPDLSDVAPPIDLEWEYLGENGWAKILVEENTSAFTQSGTGTVTFTMPQAVRKEVNGQANYWVRVRIASGDYGRPAEFEPVDPSDPTKGFKLKPGTGNLQPPQIQLLSLNYTVERAPTFALTQNGFLYSNQTLANAAARFVPFVSVKDLPQIYADMEPSFYLGFDAAFPEQPVSLFIAVEPRAFAGSVVKEIRLALTQSSALPPLQWEYFNGTTWRTLTVFDDTNNLTKSGAVEFLTPMDIALLAKFDLTARYWIRARSPENDPFDTQQLLGIFLNTIPATQAITVQTEILGSSNGQPNQALSFARTPMLPGQQVLVREPEPPSDNERQDIEKEEGKDAVQVRLNSITGEPENWVRWHEVGNFLPSNPRSRHYTLDLTTGLLKFGDGKRGLIPPRDSNNIISLYRTGGGTVGNVSQAIVAQVKSPLPGVAAVTNPVAADGGAAVETVPMVEERGPQALKHRDRAVTCSDLEWLARQAAGTRIARTKCLSNINRDLRFEPGWMTLVIIPQGTEPKLLPSSELIRAVENYLEVRAFVGLVQQTPARVNVVGPGYIQVAVVAEVAPQDIDEAQQVKQRVATALNAFFHPLTGGPNGKGWEFARDVYESEVSQVLEGVSGVDHVKFLELLPNIAQHRCGFASPTAAEIELPEGSPVIKTDRQKAALLAESVPLGTTVERIAIKGFKEGDRITKVLDLLNPQKSDPTVIDGISYPVIAVTAFNSDAVGFPRGSLVTTFDGTRRTRLVRGIPRNATAQTEIVVEDDDFAAQLQPDRDVLVVFYPFPMTVTAVTVATLDLTVQSVSGNTIAVAAFNSDTPLPQGTLVTMVDRTGKTHLAQEILPHQTGISQIIVRDLSFAASLKPGDLLRIPVPVQTLGIEPYELEVAFPPDSLLATLDNRVRLTLLTSVSVDPIAKTVASVQLHGFISGDEVKVFRRDTPDQSQSLTIQDVELIRDIAYLDDNFLVYPGAHRITMVSDTSIVSRR